MDISLMLLDDSCCCNRHHCSRLLTSVFQKAFPDMNQPPQTGKQTGKCIVSKGTYVIRLSKKAVFSSYASVVFTVGVVCSVATFAGLIFLLWRINSVPLSWLDIFTSIFSVVLLGGGSFTLIENGQYVKSVVKTIDTGVPLTRANTANLPAPDSLVRASAEPVLEPQAVLLRAATEAQERHEEQLVRASAGGAK